MKSLLPVQNTVLPSILNSQQHRLHRLSDSVSVSRWCSKSYGYAPKMQSSSLFSSHHYATHSSSTLLSPPDESSSAKKKVDVDIISRETIKPASPTPHHLRTFKLSLIDHFVTDHCVPFTLFLSNNDNASAADVVSKRSKHLKESLSEILTHFYPLAGEIKDNLYIDCNDKGVHFTEARVNQTLEEFLSQPDDQKVRALLPAEPSSTNLPISVQVNIFDCGGIALSTNFSHKIFDGHSYILFIKAWAAAVRGSSQIFSPSYVGSELFPNNHPTSIKYSMPTMVTNTKVITTKRFLFNTTALLASLKASPTSYIGMPTRVEATGGLIWKAAAKAASTVRVFTPQSPHLLVTMVNLRNRALPPLPMESVGNLISTAVGICFPDSDPDMQTLMGEMRNSIAQINSEFINSIKGEKGYDTWNMVMKAINELSANTEEGDALFLTSMLRNGVYKDIDFGWGKPVWFYYMNPGMSRLVSLNDTMKGYGHVEAMVTLSPEEMEVFERDPEILSFATVDPSPLQFLK